MGYFSRLGSTDALPADGVDIAAIARSIGVAGHQCSEEVENLISDGHLYSTTDESQ